MNKANTPKPSRTTRSSVKKVKTTKHADSGQSDESDHHQTRRSKKRKDGDMLKTNCENVSAREDLNTNNTKTHNGGVEQKSKDHELKTMPQDLNDSDNSNLSTISDKYCSSLPLELSNPNPPAATSQKCCEVDESKTLGPESEVRLRSECEENALPPDKISVEETGKNEDNSENNEFGCNQNDDHSKQTNYHHTRSHKPRNTHGPQEILDVEKEAITNIDENNCIQELDSTPMNNSEAVSQPHQVDKTINNGACEDETDKTKHTSTKGLVLDTSLQILKSNEQNCYPPEQKYISNDIIENTKQIGTVAPDISKLTKILNYEDSNTVQSTNDRSDAASCKDGIFEHCPEYSNEISSEEHKTQVNVVENVSCNQEEYVACDINQCNIDNFKNTNFVEGKQSLDVNVSMTKEGVLNNVLPKEDSIDNQNTFIMAPSEVDTIDKCSVNVPVKKDEVCDLVPNKNSLNLVTENVESETNIEALDVDSFNTNHKKFRRKNEAPDNFNYSEPTIYNQETQMELREQELHYNDECLDEQIVIDDSSSNSTPVLNENSNNIPNEDVDYSSDNLMNDIACNFGNKNVSDEVEQCQKTDLDSVDQQNKIIDNAPHECLVKDNECLNNDQDKNLTMDVVDNPPSKNVATVDCKTIEIDNNCPNIDFDAIENINQGDNNRSESEVEISLKTLGDNSECNETQIASLMNINANVQFTGGLPSMNEPISEQISKLEPNEHESSSFIEGETSSVIANLNKISEITASNSNFSSTGVLNSMNVDSEPQTLIKYEYDGFSANLREEVHSESNSDIYKDMSDMGSEKGEKKDGSLYDLGSSSDPYFGPGESEEYVSSDNGEEDDDEGEGIDENNGEEITEGDKKEIDQEAGNGEEVKNKDTALTYDQALAILNKNRVKKIDDEEFFDMFTQELNRVSDAASGGSDSDIAIVDEYLMEPEEIEENPDIKSKSGKPQQMTPSQRSIPQKQNVPPAENFQFTQPGPTQHSHQNVDMSKLGYSQGLYHQYNQGMPQINAPIMAYDHYGPGPSNAPLMTGFNPQISTGMHYSRPPLYNHHMNSTGPKSYPQGSLIGLSVMGPQNHRSMVPGALQGNTQQSGSSQYEPDGSLSNVANMSQGDKHDQEHNYGPDKSDDQNTPVLNMLGLNKEKLLLLKQVLGLDSNIDKRNLRDTIISSMSSTSKIKKKQNILRRKNLETTRKGQQKNKPCAYKVALKLLFKSILYSNKTLQSLSLENTSEDKTCSSGSCSDNTLSSNDSHKGPLQDRKVNLNSGQMFVTFNTKGIDKHVVQQKKKFRQDSTCESSEKSFQMKFGTKVKTQSKENKHNFKKKLELVQSDESFISSETEQKTRKLNRKRKFNECFDSSSSDSSGCEKPEKTMKKMVKTRSGKATSPATNYSILKLNSGTFKVDLLATFSDASGSESQSQDNTAAYLEEMKRSIRNDIAAGKNKLSNMFTMVGTKGPKRKMRRENSEDVKKPQKLRKLPADVLESLTYQEQRERGSADSETSEEAHLVDRTKKRKRSRKLKVKSAAAKQGYIPCVMPGTSTQFSLQRLDSDDPLAMAKSADNFRAERLYGSANRRTTSKELLNIKEKKKMCDYAAHRKKKS